MIGTWFKDVTDNPEKRLSDSPLSKLLENFSETLTGKYDFSLAKETDKENVVDGGETKETRELTDVEKQELKDTLGWSDRQITKCTIDEDGIINYRTDNCELAGKTSETGVMYEKVEIEINGVKIEGVFPKFDSAFDTELSPEKYKSKAYAVDCNKSLKEAIVNDPDLKNKFTDEQLKDIEDDRTPTGFVWHHSEEPGKMQLVKDTDHRANRHTGGSALWGPDSTDNSRKGEYF